VKKIFVSKPEFNNTITLQSFYNQEITLQQSDNSILAHHWPTASACGLQWMCKSMPLSTTTLQLPPCNRWWYNQWRHFMAMHDSNWFFHNPSSVILCSWKCIIWHIC